MTKIGKQASARVPKAGGGNDISCRHRNMSATETGGVAGCTAQVTRLAKHKMQAEARNDAASQLPRTEPTKLGMESPKGDGSEKSHSATMQKLPQQQSHMYELQQQQSHMHKSPKQQSHMHKFPQQQSRGRAPPGVILSRMEPPPPRPPPRKRSPSISPPRAGRGCGGASQVQRGFNSTPRAPEHLGRSRSQRELSSTSPGATKRVGGSRSTTRRLRGGQAGDNAAAATKATAAAAVTAAVVTIEAASKTTQGAKISKAASKPAKAAKIDTASKAAISTKAANKAGKPGKPTKSAKSPKAQAPTARRRQNATKPRSSRSRSSKTSGHVDAGGHGSGGHGDAGGYGSGGHGDAGGHVYAGRYADAAAHGEAMGRGWGLGAASSSLGCGDSGAMLEGSPLSAEPRHCAAHSLYSGKSKEEAAAKALVELQSQTSGVGPVTPRSYICPLDTLGRPSSCNSSSRSHSSRRGKNISSPNSKKNGRSPKNGSSKTYGNRVSDNSGHHTNTATGDRKTSSAKSKQVLPEGQPRPPSGSKQPPPGGQPRPRKLWAELQETSRHLYTDARNRYQTSKAMFLFERSLFREHDLGNFEAHHGDIVCGALDLHRFQGRRFLNELNLFSSLLRARQEGTLYQLYGLK